MKKLLAIYVIGLTAMVAAIPAAKAGTIALWTFEDGTVGNTAGVVTATVGGIDGNGINGPVYVDGVKTAFGNKGLSFNGVDQRVLIATTPGDALDLTGNFTIELGVKTNPAGGFALFMGGDAGGQDPYYISINSDGSVQFQTNHSSGSTSAISAAGVVTAGELAHIAAVYDESGLDNIMSLYVDSVLVATQNLGSSEVVYTDPDRNLWLGSIETEGFGLYNGIITDVRISDMVLGPSDFFAVPEPGMIAVFGLGLAGLALTRRRRR